MASSTTSPAQPTHDATLSFLGGTTAEDSLAKGVGKSGNLSVGHQIFNVATTKTPPGHSGTAPSVSSRPLTADTNQQLPSTTNANPQPSTSSARSLSNSAVQINKYSKIEWPMHEAKAAAKYSFLGMIVGGVIGFLISGFNPVVAGIGAWAGINVGAAYGFCKKSNPSTIRQMAVQAVAEHIRNPADFRLMDSEQEDGHEAAFLHCREALESVTKDWVSQRKSDGQEPTRGEVREYINTCAKQLAEGLNWNQLATRGTRDRAIVDLLKQMASPNPQSHVAVMLVAD